MHTLTTADNWDDFIYVLTHDRYAIARLTKIAETDPALGMIMRLSEKWLAEQTGKDNANREERRARARRQAEHEGWHDEHGHLIRTGELRPYLDDAARALLPAPRIHPERATDVPGYGRRIFWRRYDNVTADSLRVRRATRRAQHLRLDVILHPYGGPITADDHARLENLFRPLVMEPTHDKQHRRIIRPAGMTYDRALEIAIEVLERRQR